MALQVLGGLVLLASPSLRLHTKSSSGTRPTPFARTLSSAGIHSRATPVLGTELPKRWMACIGLGGYEYLYICRSDEQYGEVVCFGPKELSK
ncbi:hypothetical protein BD311DRAFT_166365 [Dichomitus squalens]|uniref:Secreted protein n=1 Tax=Dichomitus squalens TaxID=114155 RepID=A0A4Q9M7J4_9APHY|nr:hypothetical protein BD311DRAFT_166365 [Dichomitus squalens]